MALVCVCVCSTHLRYITVSVFGHRRCGVAGHIFQHLNGLVAVTNRCAPETSSPINLCLHHSLTCNSLPLLFAVLLLAFVCVCVKNINECETNELELEYRNVVSCLLA